MRKIQQELQMTKNKLFYSFLPLVLSSFAVLALSGCSWFSDDEDKTPPLAGERISVLEIQKSIQPQTDALLEPLQLASPWTNEFWPQSGGFPNHHLQHLSLNPNALKLKWSVDIGAGSEEGLPITAQPIVFNNRIFVVDARARISAYDTQSGKQIWRNTLKPKTEDDVVVGGGIAISNGLIYATNGYNELVALNPSSGGIVWRVPLPAPSRAAPTIHNNRVFVVTLDNRLLALNAQDGQKLWEVAALNENSGLLGAASPAAQDGLVVSGFSSGEVMGLNPDTGASLWADNLSPAVRIGGLATLSDIQALPVIDRDLVFAISFGGRMIALDAATGERRWQTDINGADTPFVSGNAVFLISANNDLVCLDRNSGAIRWVQPLANYVGSKEDIQTSLMWNGPLLAGNRLILTGPNKNLIEVDPQNGQLLRRMKLSGTVARPPTLAQDTLYLITEEGRLIALH
jgi:outer membrane protein assembly factor BamB